MKKAHHLKIIEMLETLNEAAAEAARLFSRREFDAALGVLADCQSFSLALGQYIEDTSGKGTKTVGLLEEYCDLLYNAGCDAANKKSSVAVKALKKHLTSLFNSARAELRPTQLEVAFMPYKASMWDSLESVYFAARNDPACEAYVVPIPYYELLADDSFGEMHYEGKNFPQNIPVTDWQDYNIEQRRPDVIFIHYPYDNIVRTGNIHPDFYCERLRAHCGRLIYIPYFVSPDNFIPDYFGGLPGILYSDLVILPSQANRKAYIDNFNEYERQNNWNGRFGNPFDKFVALGSPKIDKLLTLNKKDYTLPPEWERILQRPDGGVKKAILYNTHMYEWIGNGAEYFDKLRHVFDAFRGRTDVALWWRPHPNTEINFRKLDEYTYNAYRSMVEEYKREGFGVYDDDGGELYRALAFCDAYYGDASSLLTMFGVIQKPSMVQNLHVTSCDAPFDKLLISSVTDAFGALWAVSADMNALFKIDRQTFKARYVGSFPGEAASSAWLYTDMLAFGSCLYFPPHRANGPAVFDCERNAFKDIGPAVREALSRKKKATDPAPAKFGRIFEAKGRLFMVLHPFPGMLAFDPDKLECKLPDGWIDQIEKLRILPDVPYLYESAADEERGVVGMAGPAANALVELDPGTLEINVHKLGEEKTGYRSIVKKKGAYWLLAREKASLTRFDPLSGEVAVYDIELEGIQADTPLLFQRLLAVGDKLYLIPMKAEKPVKFSLLDKHFFYAEDFSPTVSEESESGASVSPGFRFLNSNTDGVTCIQAHDGRVILYAPGNGVLREGFISLDDPGDCAALRNSLLNGDTMDFRYPNDCALPEDARIKTLDAFLDAVTAPELPEWVQKRVKKQGELLRREIECFDGGAGAKIYEYCKKAALKT